MPEGRSLRGEISLNDKNLKNEIETSVITLWMYRPTGSQW